jgi:hypothetical protein
MLIAAGVGVALVPALVIVALLLVSARFEQVRRRRAALQVAVTDALDGELGPVVAPVVWSRGWRAWELRIPIPSERQAIVGRVLAIAHRTLARIEAGAAERVRIVLVPQAAPCRR